MSNGTWFVVDLAVESNGPRHRAFNGPSCVEVRVTWFSAKVVFFMVLR